MVLQMMLPSKFYKFFLSHAFFFFVLQIFPLNYNSWKCLLIVYVNIFLVWSYKRCCLLNFINFFVSCVFFFLKMFSRNYNSCKCLLIVYVNISGMVLQMMLPSKLYKFFYLMSFFNVSTKLQLSYCQCGYFYIMKGLIHDVAFCVIAFSHPKLFSQVFKLFLFFFYY